MTKSPFIFEDGTPLASASGVSAKAIRYYESSA